MPKPRRWPLTGAWLLAAAAALPAAAQTAGDAAPQGGRKPQDPYFTSAAGDRKWAQDYGVLDGRCNKQAAGAVVGMGGTEPGAPRRVVATLSGSVPTGKSARPLDTGDRACLGHILELVPEGRAVFWIDATAGYTYRATALRSFSATGWPCREFMLEISKGKQPVPEVVRGRACRTEDGLWGMVT